MKTLDWYLGLLTRSLEGDPVGSLTLGLAFVAAGSLFAAAVLAISERGRS